MTTPTPPAAAPTPRTDAVNECAKRLILNRPFGSSTADLLQELADLYSKHAESLERFLGSALANNDPLREKVIEFQRELAAKDARIAALEKDRDEFHGQYRMKCDVETKTLHTELTDLRAQLKAANERAERAEEAAQEQFRLYCEETKKHNATSALLAKAKEDFDYAAQALTEHAEAVGVSPDHINYIDETTKAIISAWANKTSLEQTNATLKAEVERLKSDKHSKTHSVSNLLEIVADVAKRVQRDQNTETVVAAVDRVCQQLTAARALNDTLAGAAQEAHAALVSIRADRPTAHTDEVWFMLNRAINTTDAALSAYAKSKEAQP